MSKYFITKWKKKFANKTAQNIQVPNSKYSGVYPISIAKSEAFLKSIINSECLENKKLRSLAKLAT